MSTPATASQPETRERLLQAAVVAFGLRDYDGVSTREIVKAAEANISAISYHFGGKRGLYLATVGYLADQLRGRMQSQLTAVQQCLDSATPSQCADLLCDFMTGFLEVLLNSDLGESAPGIIFREHHRPSDAYAILYRKLLQPMHKTLTSLVARYRGLPVDDRQAVLMAHALLGQAVIFRIARTTLLKRLGAKRYSRSDIAQLKQHLNHYCRGLLDAPQMP